MIIIYCDGGSRGNPGPAASAFVATVDEKIIYKESKYLGIETNNVAEYNSVIIALNWIKATNPKSEIVINLDSQLVERQLNGFYKVKNEKLKVLYNKIKLQIYSSKLLIKFNWSYREKNTLADSLVNETLDRHAMKVLRTMTRVMNASTGK